jgi:hypothetical protein
MSQAPPDSIQETSAASAKAAHTCRYSRLLDFDLVRHFHFFTRATSSFFLSKTLLLCDELFLVLFAVLFKLKDKQGDHDHHNAMNPVIMKSQGVTGRHISVTLLS